MNNSDRLSKLFSVMQHNASWLQSENVRIHLTAADLLNETIPAPTVEEPVKECPKIFRFNLMSDRKIEAIKALREVTNIGLKEAKEFVEGSSLDLSPFDFTKVANALAPHGNLTPIDPAIAATVQACVAAKEMYIQVLIRERSEMLTMRDHLIQTVNDLRREVNSLKSANTNLESDLASRVKHIGDLEIDLENQGAILGALRHQNADLLDKVNAKSKRKR
jgi:hypothetical protein